jgi:multicomponent Na+:H+ antiporter subunit D
MSIELLMLLCLLIPLIGAVLILYTGHWPNLREAVSLTTAVLLFITVTQLWSAVQAGDAAVLTLAEPVPGITIAFAMEPLGLLFALIASFLWIITTIYAIGYMRSNKEHNQTRFYVCFAIALAATIGIAFAANLFTLFIFYEVLTLSTYPLVTHHGTDKARHGGRIYLGILISTSIVFLLLAIILTWHLTGTTDFRAGGILAGKANGVVTGVLLALYVFGIGKAALMPFHRWLPAAMVAPTPVSALLHAVAVVKAGVFSVVKVIVYVFGIDNLAALHSGDWLAYIAGFTIIVASIIALRSDNLKRRLAYSTISQLSYVILATALLLPVSVMAATLHIAAHAFGKITLFFAAGAIYTAAHKTEVSQLNGIGRQMPWTMTAFAIGALSMIGIPPTAGFLSKWYLLLGTLETGHLFALAVIIVSTLLNAAYFMPIVYAAFFKAPAAPAEGPDTHRDAHHDAHGEAPWPMLLAMSVTVFGSLALFFYAELPLTLARQLVGGP